MNRPQRQRSPLRQVLVFIMIIIIVTMMMIMIIIVQNHDRLHYYARFHSVAKTPGEGLLRGLQDFDGSRVCCGFMLFQSLLPVSDRSRSRWLLCRGRRMVPKRRGLRAWLQGRGMLQTSHHHHHSHHHLHNHHYKIAKTLGEGLLRCLQRFN